MTYLVHGDSGFAKYLRDESPDDRTIIGIDANDVVTHNPDVVVCFANDNSEAYLERNLLDINKLVNACLDCGAHFHLAYTADSSGTPKAASQQGAEMLALSYGYEYGLSVTVSRSSDYATVKSMFKQIARG